MRTIIIIVGGIVLLGLFAFAGSRFGGARVDGNGSENLSYRSLADRGADQHGSASLRAGYSLARVSDFPQLSSSFRRPSRHSSGGSIDWKDAIVNDAKSGTPTGSRPMRRYEGSCHCGAIRFEIETDFPELTRCDCSICRRKNALMVKVHESQFKLLSGEDSLTEYRFHTMTARHFFCKTCGIYPFHRKRVTPDHFGINVFCLHGFEPDGIPVRQTVGAAMA